MIGASLAVTGQVAQALTDAEAWTSIEAQETARLSVGEIVQWPVLALVGEPVPSLSFLALSVVALSATISSQAIGLQRLARLGVLVAVRAGLNRGFGSGARAAA